MDNTNPEEQQRRIVAGTDACVKQELINIGSEAFANLSTDRQDCLKKVMVILGESLG